jgi:predicted deacylase
VADYKVAGLKARPGETVRGTLGEVELTSATTVAVPVVIVNGVADGPTLAVTGSVHGDEVVGWGVAVSLLRSIDPAELSGTLVVVPAANPLAIQNGTYYTPYDSVNLCGPLYWPPTPAGSLTQRIASFIAPILHSAGYYVDLHSNGSPCVPMQMVFLDQSRDAAVRRETLRIADAFGFSIVDMPGHPEAHDEHNVFGSPSGYPAAVALRHGIPALQVELVGNPVLSDVELGRIGLTNMIRSIGMLASEREPLSVPRMEGDWVYHGSLVNTRGGLLWIRRAPGTLLDEGDLVAEIADVWGETVEEIRMPVAGWCWAHAGGYYGRHTHAVHEGTMVGFIATARS